MLPESIYVSKLFFVHWKTIYLLNAFILHQLFTLSTVCTPQSFSCTSNFHNTTPAIFTPPHQLFSHTTPAIFTHHTSYFHTPHQLFSHTTPAIFTPPHQLFSHTTPAIFTHHTSYFHTPHQLFSQHHTSYFHTSPPASFTPVIQLQMNYWLVYGKSLPIDHLRCEYLFKMF